MKLEVSKGIDELRRQFPASTLTIREDGQGGAYVLLEPFELGAHCRPSSTWIGFHIPPQYPYSDIYPAFIGAEVTCSNGRPLAGPVTPGHSFEGRPALQVSRRNTSAPNGHQTVTSKLLKILAFLSTAVQ